MRAGLIKKIKASAKQLLTETFPVDATAINGVFVRTYPELSPDLGDIWFSFQNHADMYVVLPDVTWDNEGEIIEYRHAHFELTAPPSSQQFCKSEEFPVSASLIAKANRHGD